MNAITLFLVLGSFLAAEVWSPSNPIVISSQNEAVIQKDGHRIVVIEYDKDKDGHPNTKVSILCPETKDDRYHHENGESNAIFQNMLQEKDHHGQSSGISDEEEKKLAYEAKDKVTGAAHVDTVGKIAHKAKDKVSETARDVYDETKGKAAELREAAARKAEEIGEKTKDRLDQAEEKVHDLEDETVQVTKESYNYAKYISKKSLAGARNMFQKCKGMAKKMVSSNWVDEFMGVVQLFGFSMAFGMCVWMTFISSHVLAGVLRRQQFGLIQSQLYPVYFRALGSSIALALFGHLLGPKMCQGFPLLVSLLMVLVNACALEPRATKVMLERMKLEKEVGRGRESLVAATIGRTSTTADRTKQATVTRSATTTQDLSPTENPEHEAIRSRMVELSETLKKLNAYSSLLNIITLMCLTWNLVYLGQRLNVRC